MAKVSPVTRKQFAANAKAIKVTVGEDKHAAPVYMMPKEFSTGSLGWHAQGKAVVLVDGVPTECQVNIMYTVIGSKELPKE